MKKYYELCEDRSNGLTDGRPIRQDASFSDGYIDEFKERVITQLQVIGRPELAAMIDDNEIRIAVGNGYTIDSFINRFIH